MLRQSNSAAGKSKPSAVLVDNELRIGPGAIHAGQRLTYAVLVDGQESVEQISPLLNVDVQRSSDRHSQQTEERELTWFRVLTRLILPLAVFTAAAVYVAFRVTPDPLPPEPPAKSTIGNCQLVGTTLTCTVVTTPTSSPTPAR